MGFVVEKVMYSRNYKMFEDSIMQLYACQQACWALADIIAITDNAA